MRIVIIFCFLLMCNLLLARSSNQRKMLREYDSTIHAVDSVKKAKDETPYIDVHVEYNLIALDQITLQNSEEDFRGEGTRFTYPVGSLISLEPKGAGIEAMYIKIDKAQERLYTKPLRLSQRGLRTLLIRVVDEHGDEIIVQSFAVNVIPQ